ncbi:ABC transporter permease [Nocardiopsis rhodophaea]|uniref:ABC transporter permease n=1 Tax=Nocardiopsis rhodophaea TaxID=280238 RepID=A0ABP5F0U7_9ACTN
MLRTTLAGLRMHKSRLITTALAIVLGVMFVSGTLVFTDTIQDTFDNKVKGSTDRIDAAVVIDWEAARPTSPEEAEDREEPTLTPEMLARIRDLPQVAKADGLTKGDAPLLDQDGRILGFGTAGLSVGDDLVSRYPAEEGRLPAADDEVALATTSAASAGYTTGDTVAILDATGDKHEFDVVGLIDVGVEPELGGRGAVAFAPDTAAKMTGTSGYSEIDVIGSGDTAPEELKGAVAATLPSSAKAMTGQELGDEMAMAAGGGQAAFLGTALLLFAAVAMFVAGIVIYNTFAILIAQRQRETALLRCVGAQRQQIFGSVLTEALIVGILSSLLGVAAGFGLAAAAIAVVGTLAANVLNGLTVAGPPSLSLPAIAVSLLVGTLVTVVSALLPAWRATAIPPLAALRAGAVATGVEKGSGWKRVASAAVLFLVSAGMIASALRGEPSQSAMIAVVASGMVSFVGMVIIGPVLVRAIVRVVGIPLRTSGVPSMLAVDNARRSPKRAATAMIALTVGATLMTGYAVINSSTEATLDDQLGLKFPVDYALTRQPIGAPGPQSGAAAGEDGGGDLGVPQEIIAKLTASPLISGVYPQRGTEVSLDGPDEEIQGYVSTYLDAEIGTDIRQKVTAGDLSKVGPGRISVPQGIAAYLQVDVGDTLALAADEGGKRSFEIVAITEGDGPLSSPTIAPSDFAAAYPSATTNQAVAITASEGADLADVREAILATTADDPTLVLGGAAELKQEYTTVLNAVFWTVAALLGLAIIIAVFGIANTMALSVLERTRESALLRALGMTRAQLRRMLSIEAVLVSLIGAGLGVVLGVLFGWAAGKATFEDLILRVPVEMIAGFLAAAVLAGLLAAIVPARKAARTSIAGLGSGEIG